MFLHKKWCILRYPGHPESIFENYFPCLQFAGKGQILKLKYLYCLSEQTPQAQPHRCQASRLCKQSPQTCPQLEPLPVMCGFVCVFMDASKPFWDPGKDFPCHLNIYVYIYIYIYIFRWHLWRAFFVPDHLQLRRNFVETSSYFVETSSDFVEPGPGLGPWSHGFHGAQGSHGAL